MTTTNDWIKMSERRPTEADLPFTLGGYSLSGPWTQSTKTAPEDMAAIVEGWSHWLPNTKVPAPPERSTQREKDAAAFMLWQKDPFGDSGIWHAAIAYERAEIKRLLEDLKPDELHNRLRP